MTTISGFIYEWLDNKTGLRYIGKHEGSTTDGYIGSGTIFNKVYSERPGDFTRTILWISDETTVNELKEIEKSFLDSIKFDELYYGENRKYYNIVNNSVGYTSENNPMKNPEVVAQMIATQKAKGNTTYNNTVAKYGYEGFLKFTRMGDKSKGGKALKGTTKPDDVKRKISESVKRYHASRKLQRTGE